MVHDSQITLGSKSGDPPGFVPPTVGDRFFKALDLLLARDWWTRVWLFKKLHFRNEPISCAADIRRSLQELLQL